MKVWVGKGWFSRADLSLALGYISPGLVPRDLGKACGGTKRDKKLLVEALLVEE